MKPLEVGVPNGERYTARAGNRSVGVSMDAGPKAKARMLGAFAAGIIVEPFASMVMHYNNGNSNRDAHAAESRNYVTRQHLQGLQPHRSSEL